METMNHTIADSVYYGVQGLQDRLYADSKAGKNFKHIMKYIYSPENVMLAYNNIKRKGSSYKLETDQKDIKYLDRLGKDGIVDLVRRKLKDYHPQKVIQKELTKLSGKTRPIGVSRITDRLIQQCILQILEPICEAKFHNESYGFRPCRTSENAMASVYKLTQVSHLTYAVTVEIKDFFNNVNHRKLIQQLWTMGIRDTSLQQVIKRMFAACIQLPDKSIVTTDKGIVQTGLLMPLFTNVVLNELDWWIDSQWRGQCYHMKRPVKPRLNPAGRRDLCHEYRALRTTKLKEMHIVRYADDFRVFCRTKADALKTQFAMVDWISHRLKLEVREETLDTANLKHKNCEFLGFQLRLVKKGTKHVVRVTMSDKSVSNVKKKLKEQIKLIQRPKNDAQLYKRVEKYNVLVMTIQNYYRIANYSFLGFDAVQYVINVSIGTRLKITNRGKITSRYLKKRYGASKQMRWVKGIPLIPLAYCKSRKPMCKRTSVNRYTPEGRKLIKEDIEFDDLTYLMLNPVPGSSIEYSNNRVTLYETQHGKCAVTGEKMECDNIYCHRIKPTWLGGDDSIKNLILITKPVHKLLHTTKPGKISEYMSLLDLDAEQLNKLNKLRVSAGLATIEQEQ